MYTFEMTTVLQYAPGQTVSLVLEILNTDGYRIDGYEDGYAFPTISRVFFPNLTTSSLYPLPMTRIGTGLYIHNFTLPQGSGAVGTYIADGYYYLNEPDTTADVLYTLTLQNVLWQIIVSAPTGNYSASPL